jgi:hypothetical protein
MEEQRRRSRVYTEEPDADGRHGICNSGRLGSMPRYVGDVLV